MNESLLDSLMDFEYTDELLLEGCWLQATDGSEFSQQTPTTTSFFDFDSSFQPSLGAHNGDSISGGISLPKDIPKEGQRSSFHSISQPMEDNPAKTQPFVEMSNSIGFPIQSDHSQDEGYELSRRWWIGPRSAHGPSLSVMERLIQALGNINSRTRDKDVLIQVWVPVNKGGKKILSTINQPYSLDLNSPNLVQYRAISVNYQFSAEEDENSKDIVCLTGRVFTGKVPEWTPDVRFFRSEEYPRVSYAQQFDVRGTLGVPVFEPGSTTCLGVIEVVTTTQKANYGHELENVCEALEAVDLRSSDTSSTPKVKVTDFSYETALPEILDVLKSACETFNLPLAQTWVPCIQQGKAGCRHSDENIVHCIFTVDSACYVLNPQIKGFQEACSEHHLLKGQGVAGKAFATNQPCFSPDVTAFSKTEYPLSHHARLFNLCAAVAIRLRSTYTGSTDYALEFFLPANCRDPETQKNMLNSLSIIVQKVCRSLRIITDSELQEETTVHTDDAVIHGGGRLAKEDLLRVNTLYSLRPSHDVSYRASGNLRSPPKDSDTAVPLHHVKDGSYEIALVEILEVLKSACESHNLPLAQTWVPCIQQGKPRCRHSVANVIHCISTLCSACYVQNPQMKPFEESCSEHHLLKGQGVAGKALMTNQPCFSPDVTGLSKGEYPILQHARMFNLCAAVAIRLRSTYTGPTDYVLEFFFPVDCRDPEAQNNILNSLSTFIQKGYRSLRVVTDSELQEGTNVYTDDGSRPGKEDLLRVNAHEFRQHEHDSSSSTTVAFGGDQFGSGEGGFLNVGKRCRRS